MAKNTFVPKPAIEKLPLAARKDLRDNYENKKAELETKVAEQLGIDSFTSNINPNEVWAYNKDERSSIGGTLYRYLDGFTDAVRWYVEKFGDIGKEHFNDAVTQHELTVAVNPIGDKAPTIDCEIKDGVFRILFNHQSLGSNTGYINDYFINAIQNVPREGLSVKAKYSVDKYWEAEAEELTEKLETITGLKGLVLEPNFEANFKAIVAQQKDDRWHENFGRGTFAYFDDGLKYQLERQGFNGDEMLQEGLAEVATAKKFGLRVVEKTQKPNAYSEIVIEEGEVWIQIAPEKWWVNVSDAGAGLVDLL